MNANMSNNQPETGDERKPGGGPEASSTKQNVAESSTPSCPSKNSDSEESKIFNDPIHGTITVTGLCVKIIDTPQFQRLRYLKQLGGGYFVYPGASHNRFEHSIGTYYLAGQFARILNQKHEEQFEEGDIECIEIAGLCHDLGHGPFSHVFDMFFIPRVETESEWKHEYASVEMLAHLCEENPEVKQAFAEFDKDGTRLELIKDLILGGKETEYVKDERVQQKRKDKPFLYEIVANAETGIDVDKWDYFARDCHMLGIKNNFDHDRYMEFARIINVKKKGPRICARDEEASNLYDMFHTREALHRKAYQHRVTRGVELMIVDVLEKVDAIVQITGHDEHRNPKRRKISECIHDMDAYSKLNDSILQLVELPITLGTRDISDQGTDSGTLEEAREIIRRIHTRDLYKCVGKHILKDGCTISKANIQQIKKEILVKAGKEKPFDKQFEIIVMSFDYGKKGTDPVANVPFYHKSNLEKTFPLPEERKPRMLPKTFQENAVAIYSKDKGTEEVIKTSFERWYTEQYLKNPQRYAKEPDASSQ